MRSAVFIDNKMPSETPLFTAQTEQPHHYMYLKEFRTQQCPLFLQHKCTQHRPFTCFHWHFMNQRRRRPVRKRDGTFNYSPDVYCTKYDETTGLCPNGDECPFLHRTAGDTERRYHLRYYKTGQCVYETDTKGHCVKNGPHCAFAHGAQDLRQPVYDVRELQTDHETACSLALSVFATSPSPGSTPQSVSTPSSSLEKERILSEDPKWNDTNYVLANYKTEPCKRPPRLCRQGYACPQYHNTRDRRRSPKKYKYRSTPCPNVKHGDDWGDPTQCDSGENCSYCHTRTEQQFHPEIYKSTKCNDMVQTGYCPRGPFCAFAHVEQEMTTQRDVSLASENSLAAFVTNVLPHKANGEAKDHSFTIHEQSETNSTSANLNHHVNQIGKLPDPIGKERANSILGSSVNSSSSIQGAVDNHNSSSPLPEPIGKGRSSSTCSSINSDIGSPSSSYHKPLGTDKEDPQAKLKFQLQAIENDSNLDQAEKTRRKRNLMLVYDLSNNPNSHSISSVLSTQAVSSNMSALAPAFYPPGETVESVVGKALEEFTIEDFDINSIDKELDNDSTSVSSSLSAGLSASGCFGPSSGPICIPHGGMKHGSIGSLSQSPPSPFGSFQSPFMPLSVQHKTDTVFEQQTSSLLNTHANAAAKHTQSNISEMNCTRNTGQHSPLFSTSLSNQSTNSDIQRARDTSSQWEAAYIQAKNACEIWRKKAELADDDKHQAIKQRDDAMLVMKKMKHDLEAVGGCNFIKCLQRYNELEHLSPHQLRQLQQQLLVDLERLEKVILQQTSVKCMVCLEKNRSLSVAPCKHTVVCESCAPKTLECPYCQMQIQRNSQGYHM